MRVPQVREILFSFESVAKIKFEDLWKTFVSPVRAGVGENFGKKGSL
jgi:hypothetical protein